jgi:hypothetical protein
LSAVLHWTPEREGHATVARHRAPAASRWFRRFFVRDAADEPTPPPAPERIPDHERTHVIMEPIPSQPTDVRLDYPNGDRLHAGWQYAGRNTAGHEEYIVRLPPTARLANGMIVRTERDIVLAVAVTDRQTWTPPGWRDR